MAKIQLSSMAPQSALFASVFQSGAVKPPKHRQQFGRSAQRAIPEIKHELHDELEILLGIGDDSWVYGVEEESEKGYPFRSGFDSSPPMREVRRPSPEDHAAQRAKYADVGIWRNIGRWQQQIGSESFKKLLAAVFNDLMTEFVTWSYAGCYQADLDLHLAYWVEHVFSPLVMQVLAVADMMVPSFPPPDHQRVAGAEVSRWHEIAMTRLGALRVDELFEIVVDWDATSQGIDDLKHFTTNPATRSYLTTNFANTLQTRLLHPGASTIEILQIYISIIRAFRKLDPKGVLLDRVARKVRRYLRERDDTVKVIVSGLLSDAVDENDEPRESDPHVLTELAIELSAHGAQDSTVDDGEFDWNNMEWVPDPVDAAPDYMKSKNMDVIGSLISLFESKDVFVKELQVALAERLLKNKADFNQEISVVEHLKARFGDAALQGCEVMLRDVLDSRKVDNVIRRDQGMQEGNGAAPAEGGQLHAKILSRLFWPSLPEQSFTVPAVILEQQHKYEKGFEALKQSRKLTWLNAMGQVEVELELTDRVFHDEVSPFQASVIDAFQGEEGSSTRSVADLASALNMSPTLVRSACIFWASKRILAETAKDVFSVLERLPDGDTAMAADPSRPDAAAAAAAEAAAAQAAIEAEEAERKQKMAVYHQFVVSMLTNQGAMPLPRIAMMLGIVVPGGFPFGNEELKEFLGGMVKEGILELGHGGAYKVAS